MSSDTKRLFLLDGMALVYRAHFAMIRNPRLTSTGLNTSAVYVCANLLLSLLEKEQPTHLAAVFDTPEPTHRHEQFEAYKAHREEMPEDLSTALPYLFRLFEGFRIPVLKVPGYEADDVIGTLALRAERECFQTFMVTPDKDFAQLVSEKTFLYKPGRRGEDAEVLGVPEVLEQWGIERIDQVRDILGLWGDTSDNIPGVPGIGEKTAKKLIARYGSIENLLAHTDELRGKQKENLETYGEQALLSKDLVTIRRDVPIEVDLDDLAVREFDREKLQALFIELEFRALGERLWGKDYGAALAEAQQQSLFEVHGEIRSLGDVEHDYRLVEDAEGRAALLEALLKQRAVCFDVETTSLDPKTCEIVGLAFSFAPNTGFYVPLPEDRDATDAILETFRPFFENETIEKIGHHTKFDLGVLRWHGFRVNGPLFDTMLAAHLAIPEQRRTMDALAEALLGYKPRPISELIGEKGDDQKSMREVPVKQVTEYAVEDADVTLQLAEKLRPLLKETNQERIFFEVECPLVPALVEMEHAGIRIDVGALRALSEEIGEEIRAIERRIFALAGEEFNLGSPKQLGEILFEKLRLEENPKRTKTGQYATNESVLARLAGQHEIVREILNYRELTKLKSTYLDMLPNAVWEKTGRIHTTYEQAVTATGRMQSHNPNLQNIPIRTERGQEIRRAFVPRSEEYVLLSADYSQIELRIAAEMSGDEGMTEAFLRNEDIHTATAARVYGVPPDEVTPEMRSKAKTVNFGILYGISAFGLAQRMNISRTEASELIAQYFAQFPGIKRYMDETIAFARKHGYVETMLGRRRYLRDINSRNATTRRAAERNAINSRIQGTAADMIKIAMGRIHRELTTRGLRTKMLLQIHDELVFDLHRDEVEIVPPIVEEQMRTALPMRIPIVVEMGTGENWLEAH